MKKIQTASDELRTRVSILNEIKLTAIKNEAATLAKDFSTAADKADRLKRLMDLREDSTLASDLAGVELRFQKKEINQNERDRLEIQYTHESEQRKNQAEESRIVSKEKISKQRTAGAIGTWKELSTQSGFANQSYEQGINTAKDFGFKNPQGFASTGVLSENDQALLNGFREKVKEEERQINFFKKNGMPKQAAIHEDMLSEAKKPEEALNNTRELKVQSDLARHVFDEFKGINNTGLTKKGEIAPYRKTMDEEALNQEQLEADKDVLVEKYRTRHIKTATGKQVIENKISDDFDKAVSDSASPAEKARSKGKDLLDSIKLNYSTIRNNARDPLSAEGQTSFDASRSQQATDIVNSAMNQAYKGRDSSELTSALVTALRGKAGAEIMLRKDQVQEILDAIKSIGNQTSDNTASIRDLKSQSQAAPGLN